MMTTPGDSADEMADVMRWLILHPVEYRLVLSAMRLAHGIDANAQPPSEEGRLARIYLNASLFRFCSRCYWPTIELPDARQRDWPSLDGHRCNVDTRPRIAKRTALLPGIGPQTPEFPI